LAFGVAAGRKHGARARPVLGLNPLLKVLLTVMNAF